MLSTALRLMGLMGLKLEFKILLPRARVSI